MAAADAFVARHALERQHWICRKLQKPHDGFSEINLASDPARCHTD